MRDVLQPLVFLCLCLLPLAQSKCDPSDLSSWTPDGCITEHCSCFSLSLRCNCSVVPGINAQIPDAHFIEIPFNMSMNFQSVRLVHCRDPICSPPLQALELAYHSEHTQSCEPSVLPGGTISFGSTSCTNINSALFSALVDARNGFSVISAYYDSITISGTHLILTILPDTSEEMHAWYH